MKLEYILSINEVLSLLRGERVELGTGSDGIAQHVVVDEEEYKKLRNEQCKPTKS